MPVQLPMQYIGSAARLDGRGKQDRGHPRVTSFEGEIDLDGPGGA
jgi:hypothetical protein